MGNNLTPLVLGCKYNVTWQAHKSMQFELLEVKGSRVVLGTKNGTRQFETDTRSLIFIHSTTNLLLRGKKNSIH